MKKVIFAVSILCIACTSKNGPPAKTVDTSQSEIMFPFADVAFNWKTVDKQDPELKNQFIKQAPVLLKSEYEIYTSGELSEKDFENNCHVLDINNDGQNDIIYTGSTGGEGNEVAIFLKTKNGFKGLLKQMKYVKKLEFKDGKLYRLSIQDDGCCDDYNDFNRIYQVDYSNNIPQFITIYLTANTHKAYFPKKYFTNPVHFEVLNDNYKMRDEPIIDDTTKNGMGGIEFIGNNIDTLSKGAKGRAIASQTDKTGRIWWLVEIDPAYKAHGGLFYNQPDDTIHTISRMGWISSRYVKRIHK